MTKRAWMTLTLMLVAAMVSAASIAAELPRPKPCIEPASEAAASAPVRLAQLRYRCLTLRDGQHVLVGEAGAAEARTVLLVHGLGDNAHRDWARVIPALAAQFHVVTLDLPGFGGSPDAPQGLSVTGLSATLADVLDNTAPSQRVHVVGHSLGAAVSLYFAHAHPTRVDRLALVDAAGILLKTVFAQHITTLRTPQVGIMSVDRFLQRLNERIDGFRRGVFSRLDEGFDLSRWLAQNPGVRRALLGRHTQVEAALGLMEHDFTSAIRETTAPTTVIWGANDPVAPLRTGTLLAGRMPDARLKVIYGVGHTPMLESPEVFNRLLLAGLTAPLPQRPVGQAIGASQGSVVCENHPRARYSGEFDSITLDHCDGARIEGARLKQLTLKSSSLTIENTAIDSSDVALSAQHSEVIATNASFRGRVAIRAGHSRLDLAGVTLQASERGVEMPAPSRMYFSVSDWHGTDHRGDAHFMYR